ncbi:hypothetical protein P280DRAFT_480161 [Massarina eburnea CBS 473.64]|uniref:Uncharacterized protein n=1 Tax=Massarina eburnea CBS 473.64 TaxID=1395130 RepID=A0A6A6RYN9_9PLEO|nr:hypothetical protein P280DRAFT_480161 [Massarina eburnea CBS 473.64]
MHFTLTLTLPLLIASFVYIAAAAPLPVPGGRDDFLPAERVEGRMLGMMGARGEVEVGRIQRRKRDEVKSGTGIVELGNKVESAEAKTLPYSWYAKYTPYQSYAKYSPAVEAAGERGIESDLHPGWAPHGIDWIWATVQKRIYACTRSWLRRSGRRGALARLIDCVFYSVTRGALGETTNYVRESVSWERGSLMERVCKESKSCGNRGDIEAVVHVCILLFTTRGAQQLQATRTPQEQSHPCTLTTTPYHVYPPSAAPHLTSLPEVE